MKKILLVEDDEDIRIVLGGALEYEGYDIIPAINGLDALNKLRGPDFPFLILLDLNMPQMNGQEFLAKKEKLQEIAQIPVIIISASTFLRNSFSEYKFLAKPIDINELFTVIKNYAPLVTT